ncbi:MAG: cupin-like domain-containing protein [Vulcanimicrobiaceae bacterium]
MEILSATERPSFAARYNREPFEFSHRAYELPLFDRVELVALAKRLPHRCYYSTAKADVGDGWKPRAAAKMSLEETLLSLEDSDSLVMLSHCESDPEFGGLFRSIADEVVEQIGGPLRDDATIRRSTLVISSPRRVTAYHIDGETNFLLQVRGTKTLYVFDPADRTVLSDAELENFYGGDMDGAKYRQARQASAHAFALEPGRGVHIPLHAPHWAQNDGGVSVGLSLNFNLRSADRLAALYKVNRRLRTFGLAPAAPGVSPWRDRLKLAAYGGASYALPLVQRLRRGGHA